MTPEQLVDIEQIKQLKARYFRFLDAKDWDSWKEIFTADCQYRIELGRGDPDIVHHDREDFITQTSKALEGSRTTHHGHMPEIEITSPTTAQAIWAMFDYVTWGRDSDLKGYGHYHETYEKQNGHWRIKSLHLKRIRVDSPGEW